MQRRLLKRLSSVLIISTAVAALFLAGCEGDDGARGPAGPPGSDAGTGPLNLANLTPQEQGDLEFSEEQSEVSSVTISSPPVVRFSVKDSNGRPIIGLGQMNAAGTQLNNLKFSLAKLIPATNGSPSRWVNYIVTTVPTATAPLAATRPTRDVEGTLVDNGDGTYQYTFARDIALVQSQVGTLTDSGNNRKADLDDLSYNANLTHRLVIEYGGNVFDTSPSVEITDPLNLVYDFIPATGAEVTPAPGGANQRLIVLTKYCNECHGNPGDPTDLTERGWGLGITTPHNGRVDTRYCVICHTNQRAYGRAVSTAVNGAFTGTTFVTDDEVLGEFMTMIHKIHMGNRLTDTGYNYAGVMFDQLAYTQDPGLCRKCHRGDTAEQLAVTPQGNNWRTMPSRKACGSCHDNINFATGANAEPDDDPHPVMLNDNSCTACHPSAEITTKHAPALISPNNPEVAAGLTNFYYEIDSASADSANTLTVRFRIQQNTTSADTARTNVVFNGTGSNPLTGFTGGPGFLLAWALPQDNIETPADYNNRGNAAAQPTSVTIASLLAGGALSTPDAEGYYTATIPNAYPAGATLRAVALQSYFTQIGFPSDIAGRHAVAVVKPVAGDTVRRTVVDPAKCGRCHEYFEAHGGQRVYETQVCVTCHNPNLSTSGRTITDARIVGLTDLQRAMLVEWYPAITAPTAEFAQILAETSNNFKEMIHGIHAGGTRTTPFRDIRGDRFAVIDAGHIVFPNLLSNCEACHVTNATNANIHTHDADLPANVLLTTNVTNDATGTPTAATTLQARNTVPNPEDLVIAPTTGACISCHDTPTAMAHMQANGAKLNFNATTGQFNPSTPTQSFTDLGAPRGLVTASGTPPYFGEQCILCHGPDRIADVVEAHEVVFDR